MNNYKRIGDYIKSVKVFNSDLRAKELLGINIDKFFMPSVANVVGTDLSRYKIVEKNQFACNRMHVGRDYRIPVALSDRDEPFMVSPAYDVFEIKDTSILHAEYLMMWFSRAEFDRNAWFYTDADVRGGLAWKAFCDMQLPVPSIEKQPEIVKEYNTIVNRIKLNEQLNQKLEETARAIYKHWFVDFEFPFDLCQSELVEDLTQIDYSKGYKSSGGEMVWNNELGKEIPKEWEDCNFGEFVETINGFAFKSEGFSEYGTIPILKIKSIQPPIIKTDDVEYYYQEINEQLERVAIERGDILITMTGSGVNQINSAVGQVGRYYYNKKALMNQRVCKLKPKAEYLNEFIYLFVSSEEIHMNLLYGSTGSANQANISPNQIKSLKTISPNKEILIAFENIVSKISDCKRIPQQDKLIELKNLLLSKMTKVETEKEVV